MPFMNRTPQFTRTLKSFDELYNGRDDYEIILVIDPKNTDPLDEFKKDKRIRIFKSDVDCLNPARAFNIGVSVCIGEYVILTNPEVMHIMNVLAGFDEEIEKNPKCYIICSCFDSTIQTTRGAWRQHSTYNNKMLHWCSCLAKSLYEDIGGFDVAYCQGVSYDDDDFREAIFYNDIPIVLRDDLITRHLEHSRVYQAKNFELVVKNRQYYMEKWKELTGKEPVERR